MSLYAALFQWSRDPAVRGDAAAFIDLISSSDAYVFDASRAARRSLAGAGDPSVTEYAIGAFAHPAIEAFAPEPFLAALLAAIDPRKIGLERACDLGLYLDDQGRAAWIGVIVSDEDHQLLSEIGKLAAAHGLSGFDHGTDATLAHCAPKHWLLTGVSSVWDPAWTEIERAFAEAPDGEHYKTLEHPSLAMIQYLGTRDRLAIEYVRTWGAAPAYAGRGVPAGATEGVGVGHARVDVHASEVLTLADARAIFEHFFLHAEPHPDYQWRTG